MSSVTPTYQGLHLEGLLSLWIVLYTNLSKIIAHQFHIRLLMKQTPFPLLSYVLCGSQLLLTKMRSGSLSAG